MPVPGAANTGYLGGVGNEGGETQMGTERRTRSKLSRGVTAVFGLAWATASLPACAGLAPNVQSSEPTALMEQTGSRMTPREMRTRVDALVPPVLVAITQMADEVRFKSPDTDVRRRALLLKLDAVPVVYRAAFQPDPHCRSARLVALHPSTARLRRGRDGAL